MPLDSLDNVVFDRSLEQHWAVALRSHSFFDIDLETRFLIDPEIEKVMAQWNNV